MTNLFIDREYIEKLSSRLIQFKKVRNNVYNSRCPICGDSRKKKFKKRFYIFLDKGVFFCKCHNCGVSLPFNIFLKDKFPNLYREYLLEQMGNKKSPQKHTKHIKDIIPKKVVCNGFNYSCLKRFSELSKNHPARIYIENRRIPDWAVYYSDNFSETLIALKLNKYLLSYKNATEPRLIIPFYRKDKLSTVFQGRAFSKNESLRYITIKEDESESKIYGLDRVDKSKSIYCTEGPLDSLMIQNAISMSGISTKLPKGIQNMVFVFDNESRNSGVIKNMRKRLTAGHEVVIFPERIKFKDLNDMIVGGMNYEEVMEIIKENIYKGEVGLMKLNEWKKI